MAGLWRPRPRHPERRPRLQFWFGYGAWRRARRLSVSGSRLERMPKADATELAPKKSAEALR